MGRGDKWEDKGRCESVAEDDWSVVGPPYGCDDQASTLVSVPIPAAAAPPVQTHTPLGPAVAAQRVWPTPCGCLVLPTTSIMSPPSPV